MNTSTVIEFAVLILILVLILAFALGLVSGIKINLSKDRKHTRPKALSPSEWT